MFVRLFLERFNWGAKTHSKSKWYHAMGWSLSQNQRQKAEGPALISLCFLTWQNEQLLTLLPPFLPRHGDCIPSLQDKRTPDFLRLFRICTNDCLAVRCLNYITNTRSKDFSASHCKNKSPSLCTCKHHLSCLSWEPWLMHRVLKAFHRRVLISLSKILSQNCICVPCVPAKIKFCYYILFGVIIIIM